LHALADNIVVHQTNQQLNNKYDTNYYAGKVKQIESPEKIAELFNTNEVAKYRCMMDTENDSQEIFFFVKVASVNPDITSNVNTNSSYNSF